MIPITSTVFIRTRPHGFPIWIPLFIVWLLLLPIALLLLPLVFVACLAVRINPFRALSVFWHIISDLKGTDVRVEDRSCSVLVHIPRSFV